MVRKSGITNHSKHYLAVNNTIDILKLSQLLVTDGIFEESLGQKYEVEITDLFIYQTIKMTIEIFLYKYQIYTKVN